jgi:DNA-binding protein
MRYEMAEIPTAPFGRILVNAGAERTSDAALKAMREAVEDYAEALAEASVALAKHAGRKTVKVEDVKLAAK